MNTNQQDNVLATVGVDINITAKSAVMLAIALVIPVLIYFISKKLIV